MKETEKLTCKVKRKLYLKRVADISVIRVGQDYESGHSCGRIRQTLETSN